MFITLSNFDLSSGIVKMEQANSAFPRTNLAVWIVVCITEHEESAAVLARFNSLPVQSKYGRTDRLAIGNEYALRTMSFNELKLRLSPRDLGQPASGPPAFFQASMPPSMWHAVLMPAS